MSIPRQKGLSSCQPSSLGEELDSLERPNEVFVAESLDLREWKLLVAISRHGGARSSRGDSSAADSFLVCVESPLE